MDREENRDGIRTEAEILTGAAGISRGNAPPLPIYNAPSHHARQYRRQTTRGGCCIPGANVARRTPKRVRADERPDERKGLIREPNPQGQRLTVLAHSTMSPSLPPEILDLIVDHLHDEPTTLKACCVVSKSWIHRPRSHLFSRVEFCAPKSHLELWKKTFPDPSNSPAHHTRSLIIRGIPTVTAADVDAGGWIHTFHNLVHLYLESPRWEGVSLVPFHGISATLRSLCLIRTSSDVLDLICSFPLLEDLALIGPSRGSDAWNIPPTSPKLTGFLDLSMFGGMGRPSAHRLLSLPNGLHFTKIRVTLDEGSDSVMDLVSRCSDTLESISVFHSTLGIPPSASATDQYLTACRRRLVRDTFA
jgi:hypothetical protein